VCIPVSKKNIKKLSANFDEFFGGMGYVTSNNNCLDLMVIRMTMRIQEFKKKMPLGQGRIIA